MAETMQMQEKANNEAEPSAVSATDLAAGKAAGAAVQVTDAAVPVAGAAMPVANAAASIETTA
ncbi:MAG: hypothetical protein RR825_00090, partial [Ruthenibacterium sp.]